MNDIESKPPSQEENYSLASVKSGEREILPQVVVRANVAEQQGRRLYLSLRLGDSDKETAVQVIRDATGLSVTRTRELVSQWQAGTKKLQTKMDSVWFRNEMVLLLERSRYRASVYGDLSDCGDLQSALQALDGGRKEDEYQIRVANILMEVKSVVEEVEDATDMASRNPSILERVEETVTRQFTSNTTIAEKLVHVQKATFGP